VVPTKRLFDLAESEGIAIEWYKFKCGILGHYDRDPDLICPVITLSCHLQRDERLLRCVFAEELGHHFTSVGKLVSAACDAERQRLSRSEYRAVKYGVELMIPLDEFCAHVGHRTLDEIADIFFVTKDFVRFRAKQLHSIIEQGGDFYGKRKIEVASSWPYREAR